MKKSFFLFLISFLCQTSFSQIVKLYKGDQLVRQYSENAVDKVVFEQKPSVPTFFVNYRETDGVLMGGAKTSTIFCNRHLNEDKDICVSIGNKINTINKNFDLMDIYLAEREGDEVTNKLPYNSSVQWILGHQTDYIMPIRVQAVNNVDGDFPTNKDYFTGGFHGYGNNTSGNYSATMKEISKEVYVDGEVLHPSESAECSELCVIVKNKIQGANTQKKDGSGRYVILQTIKVIFVGDYIYTDIEFQPLEDIYAYQIGGLSFYNDFNNIQFVGSRKYVGIYPSDKVQRADKFVTAIRQFNDEYSFEVFIDKSVGIGNLKYNGGTYNASIESAHKSYFHLLTDDKPAPYLFKVGDKICISGGYRFYCNKDQ